MDSVPWRRIETDEKGYCTIIVDSDDLSNFPKLIHNIINARLGLDMGFLKLRLDEHVTSPTQLSDLIQYVKTYFKTKIFVPLDDKEDEGEWRLPRVQEQSFFYGSYDEDLYGYRNEDLTEERAKKHRDSFQRMLSNSDALMKKSYSEELLQQSTDTLLDHYWSTIRKSAGKSCGMNLEQDLVDVQKLRETAQKKRPLYCIGMDECEEATFDSTDDQKSIPVQTKTSRAKKKPILYAAGIPILSADFKVTDKFSLNNLQTIMDEIPVKVPGISSPYLYFGLEHSSFCWHIEDFAAFSLNYLHYGAPCIWYFVPPGFYKKFEEWCRHFFLDLRHISCTNILGAGHKYIFASAAFLKKLGIPVNVVVQREREMVLVYPYAAHSGFKAGFNVQQAVNFLDPWSVELSIFAPVCDCSSLAIQIDLKEVIAIVKPELLEMYAKRDLIGLMKRLASNTYLKSLGILPSTVYSPVEEIEVPINSLRANHWMNEDQSSELNYNNGSDEETIISDEPKSSALWKGSRCELKCPGCDKTFQGGRSKLPRLLKHIEHSHENNYLLLEAVNKNYPPKLRKSKMSQCKICMEWKAGGAAHLALHMKRKHKL